MRMATYTPDERRRSPTQPKRVALPAVAGLVLVLLAACTQDTTMGPVPAQPAAQAESAAADIERLLHAAVNTPEAGAVARALAALPVPAQEQEVQVRNLHVQGQLDTLRMADYGPAQVEVYVLGSTGEELLRSVHVDGAAVEFAGLRVGATAEEARSNFAAGPLHSEDGAELYLITPEAAPPIQVTLHLSEGELAAFTVHAYLD